MLVLVGSLLLAVGVHVTAMALAARALGIGLLGVSYGLGPRVFAVGLVTVRLVPAGGYIQMKRAPDYVGPDVFDERPVWRRVALHLAGPAALVALAVALLGGEGWRAFLATFVQIPLGALAPGTEGQRYVAEVVGFVGERPPGDVVGAVAAKVAASNLLPFPALNGGGALRALVWGRRGPPPWEGYLVLLSMLPLLALYVGWAAALVAYVG